MTSFQLFVHMGIYQGVGNCFEEHIKPITENIKHSRYS
jgi:hypothetical protein